VGCFVGILGNESSHGIGDFLSAGVAAEVFGVQFRIGGDAFHRSHQLRDLFEPFAPRRQPSVRQLAFQPTCSDDGAATSARPRDRSGEGIDDMLTIYRTYTLAAIAAALGATAIARLHQNDAEVPNPNVQTERSHQSPGDTNAQASYLPDLFVEEERAARIEPMPPQF
jgi:hypothetical protein